MTAVNLYTTGQTFKNIVDDCERLSNNPKLNLDPLTGLEPGAGALKNALAYRWLLDILRSLYTLHDWPFLITAKTLTLPNGASSVSLPPEFMRTSGQELFFWIIASTGRTPIYQQNRELFFADFPTVATPGKPQFCYVDRISGSIFLKPFPDQTYLSEFHFQQLPRGAKANSDGVAPDTINDVPWFPHQDYLTQALLVRYYIDQDDTRAQAAEQMRLELWSKIRGSAWDQREGGANWNTVALDATVFPPVPNF